MTTPLRVGLIGAGPWATLFTAPLLAAGASCELTAVWARRADAAQQLAARHGVPVAATVDELVATCEAVAFAVPPDVQADLAAAVAASGRAVLLEKPIGLDLRQAERLTAAIDDAGVVSQLVLTNRYRPSMRAFLHQNEGFDAVAARATFFGDGAIPGSYFGTPWRLEQGGLLDLGPHVLDALDAALGPIVGIEAAGDPLGVIALLCAHEGGPISQATISATTPTDRGGLTLELIGRRGVRTLDTGHGDATDGFADIRAAMATLVAEFADAVRTGRSSDLDVHRGLHLQRLLDDAGHQLRPSL
jgi:predicted dehydrogenase